MNPEQIYNQLKKYNDSGKRIFVSSSFQTHSIPLLHIISKSSVQVDVLFLNTGFHFPETLSFRDDVVKLLGLNLINVNPQVTKINQKDHDGDFYFMSDPDTCCYMNKTQAMEPYLHQYDIWISGVRADQSKSRELMKIEQDAPSGTTRFHPMLDWNLKEIYKYKKQFNLPEHPLDKMGYQSIGCAPCTRKFDLSDERSGRWFGMNKTECGLHTDLISK